MPKLPISLGSTFAAIVTTEKIIATGKILDQLLPQTQHFDNNGAFFSRLIRIRRSTHRPSSGRQRCCRPSLGLGAGERRHTRALMMSMLASYRAPISGGRRMAGMQSFGWEG